MDEIYTDQFGEPLSEDDIIDGGSNIPEEYFNLPEDEFRQLESFTNVKRRSVK